MHGGVCWVWLGALCGMYIQHSEVHYGKHSAVPASHVGHGVVY